MGESEREWSRYGRDDATGVQALRARFFRHAYGRHTHDEYVLGVVHTGAVAFRYRGAARGIGPGSLMLLDPNEAHDGRPAVAEGFLKSVVYVPPNIMERVIAGEHANAHAIQFAQPSVRDVAIAAHLSALCDAILEGGPRLRLESELEQALVLLARRYGAPPPKAAKLTAAGVAVRNARDYIRAGYDRDISLDELARVAQLSRFHLVRAFAKQTGLTPHAYLTRVRLDVAKRMIGAGEPAAAVAGAVGFADQSHLIRRFKRAYGITPAQYAASKNVQDAR